MKGTLALMTSLKAAHKTVIEQSKSTYDIDEEDLERLRDELAKVGRVTSQVMELSGQLVEKFNDQALAIVTDNCKDYWATQL